MEFYEQKSFSKEELTKRFANTKEYFKFGEIGGFSKFLDTIFGWFTFKSKIYSIE